MIIFHQCLGTLVPAGCYDLVMPTKATLTPIYSLDIFLILLSELFPYWTPNRVQITSQSKPLYV